MNCDEFHKQLNNIVERRGVPTNTLREHGTQCPQQACQRRWQEFQLLERLLGPWKSSVPAIDLTARIRGSWQPSEVARDATPRVSILREQDSSLRRSPHLAVLASFAGVAVLLIALLTSLQTPSSRSVANNQGASPDPTQSNPEEFIQVADSDEQALQEIGSKCVGWMEGATHRLSDAVTYVISPSQSPMDIMPPMRDPEGWLKTWGERLEPIEDSLDRTLRQLLQDSANPMGNAGDRTS